tara:strand:+ start:1452 stop:1895 length:444 start_codon:yes stop_codon:yes gene_type:complete
MINDFIKMKGELILVLSNPEGNIKQSIIVPNLVVTTGKNYIADRMKNNSTVMSHMEVGTGTTSAAAGNTALVSAIGSSRTALASTTVTNNAVAYVCNFGAGVGTGAVTEAGIFNASSGGTMLCRTVFSAINKGANDTLGITWTITVS